MKTRIPSVSLLLIALAFSGCAAVEDSEPTLDVPDVVPVDVDTGEALPVQPWQVGAWWGYHAFFGPDDNAGIHFNTIVVDETDDTWILGSDDPELAAIDAMFNIPILGAFSKDGLEKTPLDGPTFRWYQFPLQNGSTWTFMQDDGEFVAFAQEGVVETPLGRAPGHHITVLYPDGNVFAEYDHTEVIGWSSSFTQYRPDGTVDIEAMSMGFGDRWDGEAYQTSANLVFDAMNMVVPPALIAEPQPITTFEVSEDATHVWAVVYAVAAAGAAVVELVDPEGGRYEALAVGASDFQTDVLDRVPAIPGTWTVVASGAGVVSASGGFGYELTETVHTF